LKKKLIKQTSKQANKQTSKQANKQTSQSNANPWSLCSENENAQLAPVRGEASPRRTLLMLDAVRSKPRGPKHVSNGVPTGARDHADQPPGEHGRHS